MNKFFSLVLILTSMSNCGSRPKQKEPAPAVEPKTEEEAETTPDQSPKKTPPLGLLPTVTSMQEKLVAERCLSCHKTPTSANRYIDLHDLNAILTDHAPVSIPGAARLAIRKGCPKESIFYAEIVEGSMPMAGVPQIDDSDKKVIYDWILSLAPQGATNCSDEPPDDETYLLRGRLRLIEHALRGDD
jgi:hypothetical protein